MIDWKPPEERTFTKRLVELRLFIEVEAADEEGFKAAAAEACRDTPRISSGVNVPNGGYAEYRYKKVEPK